MYEKWLLQGKEVEQTIEASGGKKIKTDKLLKKYGVDKISLEENLRSKVAVFENFVYREEYRVGFFITRKETSSEFPVLYKTLSVFVAPGVPYATCKLYNTVEYNILDSKLNRNYLS